MKYEFVEFYPLPEKAKIKNPKSNLIGTVHIYCICQNFDLRGIRVVRKKSKKSQDVMFHVPHMLAYDEEGNQISYPFFSWTKREDQQELMKFLHDDVKPKVKEMLKVIGE